MQPTPVMAVEVGFAREEVSSVKYADHAPPGFSPVVVVVVLGSSATGSAMAVTSTTAPVLTPDTTSPVFSPAAMSVVDIALILATISAGVEAPDDVKVMM
mmetsp:Transcript_133826/g.317190  ORF Transcript_133826/g.317190 Transcript_133826/m.317190 type:complete len:100 (+) Transcript_133826:1276-1575(+)